MLLGQRSAKETFSRRDPFDNHGYTIGAFLGSKSTSFDDRAKVCSNKSSISYMEFLGSNDAADTLQNPINQMPEGQDTYLKLELAIPRHCVQAQGADIEKQSPCRNENISHPSCETFEQNSAEIHANTII